MGFLLRFAFALALVALTYNPTRWNFTVWAAGAWREELPLVLLFGLLLLAGWAVYLNATLRSIGVPGMLLILALLAAAGWVLWDRGLLEVAGDDLPVWLGILAVGLVLGIGMSWSILWRRLSGQIDVDETSP
jgi:hypothetical protein